MMNNLQLYRLFVFFAGSRPVLAYARSIRPEVQDYRGNTAALFVAKMVSLIVFEVCLYRPETFFVSLERAIIIIIIYFENVSFSTLS